MSARKTWFIVLVASIVALAGVGLWQAGVAQARPPAQQPSEEGITIPYPGRLTDDAGNAVADGAYDLGFSLYDAEQGGTPLWSETQTGVSVRGGAFLVSLGRVNALPAALLESSERWLEIAVRGPGDAAFTTLAPRQRLEAVSPPAAGISQAGGPCPHDHWGETWSGSGSGLELVTSDGSAILGTSADGTGVFGQSGQGAGLLGLSWNDEAVLAIGQTGVYASGTYTGVYATASLSGRARGVTGAADNAACLTGQFGCHGVLGSSDTGNGVSGFTKSGTALLAISQNGGAGLIINNQMGGNFITANSGVLPPDQEFRVEYDGDVYADGTYNSPAADFAEMLPSAEGLQPGDVLVVGADGKLTRSTQPYQVSVVGVYSTRPAFLGGSGDDVDLAGQVPLAVIGVAPVKVTTENGPIHPGDLLVTSSTPGRAMKASPLTVDGITFYPSGVIIGKALEPLERGTGVIQMLVVLQ